ncbi:MAG: hypothetical protein Q8L14_23005 [Myxococcales bacterium]|nr:hypothetical protein [Myxococcales bacterium]
MSLTASAQGLPSAPSDDPAPAEATTTTKPRADVPLAVDAGVPVEKSKDEKDRPRGSQGFVEARGGSGEMRFGGVDLGFTTFFSSGLFFAPESYTASLSVWLEPSWRFGAKFFKGSWFESMLLAVRLPIELEFAGSDPRFRGATFSNPAVLNAPSSRGPIGYLESAPVEVGLVDGPTRTPVILGDTWVSLIQGKTLTIPGVGISLANSFRIALPTSLGSRNTGFVTSLSLGFIFDKGLGPVHLTYVFRPVKYFYERAVSERRGSTDTVIVNGRTEETWRPPSTGVANPSVGLINGLSASVELPLGFSVSSSYFLFNLLPYALAECSVAGVPQANCSDQPKFGGSQWRNDHWFLASVDWSKGPVSLSLGLSTYRSVNQLDGKLSQPFIEVNRNNATTVYLSFSTSAEQLVDSFAPEKK